MVVFLRWLFICLGIAFVAAALLLWLVATYLPGAFPPMMGLRIGSLAPLVLVGLALLVPGLLLCLVPTRRRHLVLPAGRGGRPRPPAGGGRAPRRRLDRL